MCPVTMTALAVTAGMTAGTVSAAVVGTALSGALIGMGATAVMNVATGRSITSGLGKAALFGAIGGGVSAYAGSFTAGAQSAAQAAEVAAAAPGGIQAAHVAAANANTAAIAATTAMIPSTGSVVMGAVTSGLVQELAAPPVFAPVMPQASQQDFSGGQIRTTGSGGSKAAVSLAEAVARTKQRKLSQADVSSLSVDTSSFASGGLQFA